VKAVIHRPIEGKVKTVTVSRNCLGQYHASVLFEDGKEKPHPSTEGKAVGVDLGMTYFAITSDGSKFDHPRWMDKHNKNLKTKQRQLARKQKGSSNRNKARKKVTKVHNQVTRCREDFLHKLSSVASWWTGRTSPGGFLQGQPLTKTKLSQWRISMSREWSRTTILPVLSVKWVGGNSAPC